MGRFVKTAAAIAAAAALVAAPDVAHANGRFPESNQLFFASGDPQHLVLRTTFGLLDSRDRGATWTWICDQAVQVSGSEDPMVAMTPSGNMLATTFQGLSIAKDRACSWSYAGGDLAEQVFIDLSADPNDAKHVAVFASSYDRQDEDGGIYFVSKIWDTKDEGATFSLLGPAIDPTLLGYTLDLTKSDPDRVYVSATRYPGVAPQAVLLTSKDRGQTWSESSIALVTDERAIFIAAVDPTNADRVYVRTSAGLDKPSRLLVSDDGGTSFRVIYQGAGPLLGFALAEDGSKVYVGGPKDGIQAASTSDFSFTKKSSIEVQCLALAGDGLWACSNERSGFIIAVSEDEGATFEKQTHFCDIRGPLDCPVGSSVNANCAGRWEPQKALLGCGTDGDGGFRGDASDGGAGSGPNGDPGMTPGGGFDCRTSPASPLAAFASVGLAFAGLAAVQRRRRRR